MGSNVLIITQSDYFHDPRVKKETETLLNDGFNVRVFCYGIKNNEQYSDLKNDDSLSVTMSPFVFHNLRENFRKKTLKTIYSGFYTNSVPRKMHDLVTKPKVLGVGILDFTFTYILSNIDIFWQNRNRDFDIVHATDLNTLFAGYLLKKLRHKKLVYDSHELWIEMATQHPLFISRVLYHLEKFLIRRCDHVITVNSSIAKELSTRYSIRKPTVIYNCPFHELSNNQPFSNKKIKIIYQGGYAAGRGLEEVIKAADHIPENCEIYLRGVDRHGTYVEYLKDMVKNHCSHGNIFFIPAVAMDEMISSLDGFDIGIIPYKAVNYNNYLATPNKLFEYMMAGLPILASDFPEMRNFVSHNEIGLLFNPENPLDIASKISSMVSNIEKLKTVSKKCKILAAKRYNWNKQGEKLIKIYRSL